MARYVKISTIGGALDAGAETSYEKMAEQVIDYWDNKLASVVPDKPDMIVLPEMCDRLEGLPDDKTLKYYDTNRDMLFEFFSKKAKENNCYLVYSTLRKCDDNSVRNSSIVLDRKGEPAGIYDKNHIVIQEATDRGITSGDKAELIECDFGKIACVICFDLNYDQLRKKYIAAKPDLIVFPSMFHGALAQSFWAYTCRAHFVRSIGLPTIKSQIRDPFGDVLAATTEYYDFATAEINLDCRLAHLDFNYDKITALKKKYKDKVEVKDPGNFATVLISSKSNSVGIDEMFDEFGIEAIDDYLARSLEYHNGSAGPA